MFRGERADAHDILIVESYRVDFHVHTRVSPDALDRPETVVDAARRQGLDAIAITDHDRSAAYSRLCDLGLADPAGRPVDGLLVIPGVEVSCLEGHVLVLGATFDSPGPITAAQAVATAHARGAIAAAAHPFDRFRSGVGIATLGRVGFDAVEAWNSKTIERHSNDSARAFALEHDLPMIGGSDAHFAAAVGRACTLVTCDEFTAAGVLSAVRSRRTEIVPGAHSAREILRYWGRGWLTRPWLFDMARRGAAAAAWRGSPRRREPVADA
jgi:predicted metal-dependent phosphoesterase TrpH